MMLLRFLRKVALPLLLPVIVSALAPTSPLFPLPGQSPLTAGPPSPAPCRCTRDESCWPAPGEWARLNTTVQGQLVAAEPPGAPCHAPQYDAASCAAVREAWPWPEIHARSPASVMNPLFQRPQHCHPFGAARDACLTQRDGSLVVNVTSAADVAAGLAFARAHNLRVVVKNTGHDYTGKSASDRNTLTLWTRHLSSAEHIARYESAYHSGSALRLGAGVSAAHVVDVAHRHRLRVAGGFCPSVGFAGGYIQGGGHGPLSSLYGLAVDQVLEWEVVTSRGQHVVASPAQHEDLYWALAGGGGGVFGVVISVTVRAFPDDAAVGGASLSMQRWDQPGDDVLWDAFDAWQSVLPALLDARGTAGYAIMQDAFVVQPATVPGFSETAMKDLLRPLVTRLDQVNATYELRVTSFPSYHQHYTHYQGPLPWGPYPIDLMFGGKLVPKRVLDEQRDALGATVRRIVETTSAFLGFVALDTNHSRHGGPVVAPVAPNAVLPAWREAHVTVLAQSQWNLTAGRAGGLARAREMTDVVVPALGRLVAEGAAEDGTYLNEADPGLADWQWQFYGSNWARLVATKEKWDPDGLLWVPMGVGSQAWSWDPDRGRLCRIPEAEGV